MYPPPLAHAGLGPALTAVARRSRLPVRVRAQGLDRQAEPVEITVYFCCVECLQNAAKHAGPGTSVTIDLRQRDGWLEFSVADDGAGFDPAVVERRSGLTNLVDRATGVGGTLRIESWPGRGTRVTGSVPMRSRDRAPQ